MDVLTVPTKSFPGLTRNKGQPAAASTASRAAGFSQRPLADRLRLTVRAQESCGRGRCLVGGADGGFGGGPSGGGSAQHATLLIHPAETQRVCVVQDRMTGRGTWPGAPWLAPGGWRL